MVVRTFMVGLAIAVALPSGAWAQDPPVMQQAEPTALERRAQDVVAWLKGEITPEQIFAPQFLAAISAETLAQMNLQLASQFGAVIAVESLAPSGQNQARIAIRFERAIGSGSLAVSGGPDGLISGLQLSDFTPVDTSAAATAGAAQAIAAELAALPGETAAWFGPLDGEPIFTQGDPQAQFALGSAFKLYVLGALGEAVAQGRLRWDQVVPIGPVSFPSGIMQSWPAGAPVTVQTLATLMISISDNTATDTLIRLVGREAVEDFLRRTGHSDPERSLPFLTTREMFLLKTLDTGPAYAEADSTARRRMLDNLDGADVTAEQVVAALAEPVLVEEIEWFASMADERKLLRTLATMPDPKVREIMAVSPQLSAAQRVGWSYVGFKGGSEPGVLNYTWLLRDDAGRWHMLATSWLDPEQEVDSAALGLIALRILALRS